MKQGDRTLVFRDQLGEPIGGFRTAWRNFTALTPACQQAFKQINLRWHDLRHEYESSLIERGAACRSRRSATCSGTIRTRSGM